MSLAARIEVRRDTFRLRAELDVGDGEVVALLGPSGAGKSTALRALAGLRPIDAGAITIDGVPVDDPVAGVLVPAHRRPVGVVFQDYLLFPHLSALDNIAFGPRARGARRAQARATAHTWLARVGMSELAGRRPRQLSGGQQQRVALARALAGGPRLLLLDEPLSALDAATRAEVRADLAGHLRAFPGSCVLVTHDPLEALVLADRLVVVEAGEVVQQGTPSEIARRPRTPYVAALVGLNLFRGKAEGSVVTIDSGTRVVVREPASGQVLVAVRPAAVSLHLTRPEGSPRNVWQSTVAAIEAYGDRARVRLEGPVPLVADVTVMAVAELRLVPGAVVWAAVKAGEVDVYRA